MDACPVDHKTRSVWLSQAATSATADAGEPNVATSSSSADVEAQHDALLRRHDERLKRQQGPRPNGDPIPDERITALRDATRQSLASRLFWAAPEVRVLEHSVVARRAYSTGITFRRWGNGLLIPHAHGQTDTDAPPTLQSLDRSRAISSIPRASTSPHTATPNPSSSSIDHHAAKTSSTRSTSHPANAEHETGASTSGHWVYPSEQQFFDAMARKGHAPMASDMRTIVPIHNAVNERAWREIQRWEKGWGGDKCGGIKLVSFLGKGSGGGGGGGGGDASIDQRRDDESSSTSGSNTPSNGSEQARFLTTRATQALNTAATRARTWWTDILGTQGLSPRARWRVFMGYKPPFDRHDWVVQRCDKRIEYIIDFYEGRPARAQQSFASLGGGDAAATDASSQSLASMSPLTSQSSTSPSSPPHQLSFYLDVRPKLNSWEGWKMRTARLLGLMGVGSAGERVSG